MSRGPIPDKSPLRPRVSEVQPLIDAFYQFEHCGVGGGLHVVLDDGNWEPSTIQGCIDDAADHWAGHVEATRLLGRLLLLLTPTQRHRLQPGYDGPAMPETAFQQRCRHLLARAAAPPASTP